MVLEFPAFARTKVKTLHKYLVGQVLASLFLTVAVFTFVLLLGNALKDILTLLINGQVRFGIVVEAIGYLIPFVLVFALPMGLLTSTLLVFGRFSADRELTAVRASGISLLSLVMPVLLLSLFFCVVSAWINMDLGPRSRVASKDLISRARSELVNMQFPEGHSYIPGYIFYVEKNHDGNLQNVMVDVLQSETRPSTFIHAPRGKLETDFHNKQLILHLFDAWSETETSNGTHTIISSLPELFFNFDLNAATNRVSKPSISNMTFWQLHDEMNELKRKLNLPQPALEASSKESGAQLHEAEKERLIEPIRVAMHQQIAFSFACFGFTLIGIPLGIRVHRRETNIGVAMALVLVVIYYSFIMLGGSLSSRPEFLPHLIFWVPNFIFQIVGAVLLWRANRGI